MFSLDTLPFAAPSCSAQAWNSLECLLLDRGLRPSIDLPTRAMDEALGWGDIALGATKDPEVSRWGDIARGATKDPEASQGDRPEAADDELVGGGAAGPLPPCELPPWPPAARPEPYQDLSPACWPVVSLATFSSIDRPLQRGAGDIARFTACGEFITATEGLGDAARRAAR